MSLTELLGLSKLTPASYLEAARQIQAGALDGLKALRVALLATFTADPLQPYLVVESAVRGLLVKPYLAPFNQVEQQVFDRASGLYAFRPDVIAIATRLEEIAPRLLERFLALSSQEIEEELDRIEGRVQRLLEGLRQSSLAPVLVFNYAAPAWLVAGVGDASLACSQLSVVQRVNDRLATSCTQFNNVAVFDYARLVGEYGLRRWSDPKLWYLARIPFGAEAQRDVGRALARHLRATCFPPCKCLVLDVDHTLWGGVLAEDGLQGIALGEDYPGNVFKEFQRRVLSLRDRGILLAIASKNNEAEVLEALQHHRDSLLKPEHFAAMQIHWQDKAVSLRAIASALNISTDALAFFDDSPVERAWVRSQMPEVTVIDVPESPLGFVQALEGSGAFDQLFLSPEDRQRAQWYHGDQARKRLQTAHPSLETFLEELEMTVTIGEVSGDTLPRVAQLVAKTNQFNLTTRRHTAAHLESMLDAGAVGLWIRVRDRFGDHGLVGVTMAVSQGTDQWTIDTFLLSCRVIGRRIETALLSALANAVRIRGGKTLVGEYLPTPKNAPAEAFYPIHGFEPLETSGRRWVWDFAAKGTIPMPSLVQVESTAEVVAT